MIMFNKEKYELVIDRIEDLENELSVLNRFTLTNVLSTDQTLRLECLKITKDLISTGTIQAWNTTNVVDLVDNLVEYVKTGKLDSSE